MMSSKLLALTLITTVSMSGCLQTREDLRDSENKSKSQDQVALMQRAEAHDSGNKIAELETSIRELNGRLEVAENKVVVADQAHGQNQQAWGNQLEESNRRNQLLQEEVTKLQGQLQNLSDQVTQLNTSVADAKNEAAQAQAAASDKRTPFEIGEDLFQKKDWKKAIVSYQRYRDQFPKGKQFSEATYKIGVCFQELGMKDEAKTFYDELVGKSPGSSEAKRAKIRLKKL